MAEFRLPWIKSKAKRQEETQRRLDEFVLREVQSKGVTIVPVESDGRGPSWAYTVGLHELHGAPELIAFALSAGGAARLVSDVATEVSTGRLALQDGMKCDHLWPSCEFCFRRVSPDQYLGYGWFYLTKRYYEQRTGSRQAVEAFQIFLPDVQGRYPWEDGCAEGVRQAQPRLFLPFDPDRPAGGALADAPGV